ncbi:MAG: hypothetical protein ACRDNS_02700, partial [Trebonia sp.]
DESLIERIRDRLDLADVLRSRGYDQRGTTWRHPNSTSGSFGADIRAFGGTERLFSHNATDPLHASNLPSWCGGVTALDAFDVLVILDFGGDRRRALAELAQRFGIRNAAAQKAVARTIFRMIRKQAPQEAIEAAAFAEAQQHGMSVTDMCRVARWVAAQATTSTEAA